jgi:hypothetical protein
VGYLLLTELSSGPDATSLPSGKTPRPIMNSINVDQDSTIGTDLENAPPAEKTVQRVTAYGVSVGDTEPGQAAKGA